MITREQAIQALREIKEICSQHDFCYGCPLNNKQDICPANMTMDTDCPRYWWIPEEE